MRQWFVALVVVAGGVAVGALSLRIAARDPTFSFAGSSLPGRLALACAGWALLGCGVAFWLDRPASRFGPLVAAAGFAWFLLEWNNPAIGSSVAFTVGLVFYAACPPIAAHAVLTFPGRRLSGPEERSAVVIAYAGSLLLLGLLPALFFDPAQQGCGSCPNNLLVVADRPSAVEQLNRAGVWALAVCASALAVLAALKVIRSPAAERRAVGPVVLPGFVYLGLVGAIFTASLDRGLLWNGSLERQLWRAQAVALLGIVAGVGWCALRAHRRRSAVARLALELAQSPPPGRLREAFADIVGDPALELAYPLESPGRIVDAQGQAVELHAENEHTSLVAGDRMLAVLAHRRGLLDDEELVAELTAAARLGLENERLQAEVRARVVELRSSRTRIVEAGDAERRRLERDLHDGAQQRLAGVALSLSLLRSRIPPDGDPEVAAELAAAEHDVQSGIAGLRELAHGIFPTVLADGGLSAALVTLAEEAEVPIRLERLSPGRLPSGVETAAYAVVAEAASAAAGALVVRAERSPASLVLDVEAQRLGASFDRSELDDRVGAADGHLTIVRRDGTVKIRAEFPCEL